MPDCVSLHVGYAANNKDLNSTKAIIIRHHTISLSLQSEIALLGHDVYTVRKQSKSHI